MLFRLIRLRDKAVNTDFNNLHVREIQKITKTNKQTKQTSSKTLRNIPHARKISVDQFFICHHTKVNRRMWIPVMVWCSGGMRKEQYMVCNAHLVQCPCLSTEMVKNLIDSLVSCSWEQAFLLSHHFRLSESRNWFSWRCRIVSVNKSVWGSYALKVKAKPLAEVRPGTENHK